MIALNPIQWMASDDGWLDPAMRPGPEQLLGMVRQAGFAGVMAEVPAGWSVDRYLDTAGQLGLALAPGYFVCRSDGRDGAEDEVVAAAQAVARQHAELGQRDIGLGLAMARDAVRVGRPARGAERDDTRLNAITALIGRIAEAMRAEGIRPALHPHVGTWVETEQEARAVLDAFDAATLGFLPDTGHLAWAGADVPGLISKYAERVPFLHVKDCQAERSRKRPQRELELPADSVGRPVGRTGPRRAAHERVSRSSAARLLWMAHGRGRPA